MAQADLIARRMQSTPFFGGAQNKTAEIPADVLKEASKRLQIVALLAAVLWIVVAVVFHLQVAPGSNELRLLPYQPDDNISVVGAVTSLALYLYARQTRRDPHFILNLGLVYMILTAAEAGYIAHPTSPVPPNLHIPIQPTISWIGVIIIFFAAIIPASSKKIIVAGVIAASMNIIAMYAAKMRGMWDFGSNMNMLLMHVPDFLLVGVAVVVARVVTRLGQKVSKAREMGSYQLGELIKRGGMGEIYRATHRMLARPAAIKLIRAEMLSGAGDGDSEIAIKRFHLEATAAANLRSPHTVELFDFGVTEDQTLYFVMELLKGMDLETMVREHGPLPPSRVIHILQQVCESLQEAHENGLVHRDIKPENIHVGHIGIDDDFVKVLDFGLVKSLAPNTGVSLGTGVGLTPGTPAYMAPEMALGDGVDGRADLYALGCVAYYLLTGKLVYEAENTFQMIAKHVNTRPVPPSERCETKIPADLEKLVLKCLEKNPADRPASAAELRYALSRIDVEPWTSADATMWWKANVSSPAVAPTL